MAGQRLPAAEMVLEVVYSLALHRGLVLEPDLQYVVDPAAEPGAADALVLGLRLILSR